MLWTVVVPTLAFSLRGTGSLCSSRRAVLSCADAGPSPEDWREFRRRLISGGISVTNEEDGGEVSAAAAVEAEAAEREVVAPANEELLRQQNEDLWKEYLEGTWAHESPYARSADRSQALISLCC